VLFVVISATPLPWVAYGIWAAVLGVWVYAESRSEKLSRRRVAGCRAAAVATCAAAGLLELPYHVTPRPVAAANSAVGIIGDSVTAGMGENEAVTWPRLLAERHNVVVHDQSQMGATVTSAQKQAAKLRPEDEVVVIEIGGNDLLGSTSVAGFETGLDALLNDVARPGRRVVMFELPLPPGFNAYGQVQRRLAAEHRVKLIPKRVLMGVLAGHGATLDSIHLSQAGHELMAEAVGEILDLSAPAK
jgi:acyl-CoA thioesterase-1